VAEAFYMQRLLGEQYWTKSNAFTLLYTLTSRLQIDWQSYRSLLLLASLPTFLLSRGIFIFYSQYAMAD